MSITTNIIQNVYYANGNTACNAGTQYCSEGYSIYVPCLKDITRGQDACFNFYVADNSTQDVINLDEVDAISLSLSGLYGCQYGTYSDPDNIFSLQKNSYSLKYSSRLENRDLCELSLVSVDINDLNVFINVKDGTFYSGTNVEVSAYDTPTHMFIGWAIFEDNGDSCDDETIEDYIVSESNVYKFIISEDIRVYALYRSRKKYDIIIDPSNKKSHYNVTYKTTTYHISNRPENLFDDGYDKVSNILEGYSIRVECIPNMPELDSESDSDDDYAYRFLEWKDGDKNRIRILHPGVDTSIFENGNEIRLYSICYGPVDPYEIESDTAPVIDYFDEDGIHIITGESDSSITEYSGDEYTISVNNVYLKSIEDELYILINNGELVLSPMDITDEIQINIQAISDDGCELIVEVNGIEISNTINPEDDIDKINEYFFNECGNSNIVIKTTGKCLISSIEVYKVNITDKGLAMFCLQNDTVIRDDDENEILFEDIPTGPLYVSGAIMVNGQSYGLSQVQIGNVNKLNKISIL